MKIDWKKAIGLTAAVSMLVPLAACGGSSDGAGEQVVPLATPGKDISSYDVTPGMIRLIAGNAKAVVIQIDILKSVILCTALQPGIV